MPPSHPSLVVCKARRLVNNGQSSLVVAFNHKIDFKYRDVLLINVLFHIEKKKTSNFLKALMLFCVVRFKVTLLHIRLTRYCYVLNTFLLSSAQLHS